MWRDAHPPTYIHERDTNLCGEMHTHTQTHASIQERDTQMYMERCRHSHTHWRHTNVCEETHTCMHTSRPTFANMQKCCTYTQALIYTAGRRDVCVSVCKCVYICTLMHAVMSASETGTAERVRDYSLTVQKCLGLWFPVLTSHGLYCLNKSGTIAYCLFTSGTILLKQI